MYIEELTSFFNAISKDERINAFHISLYMALFEQWNQRHFQDPVSITRKKIMRISRLSSRATYHKYIKDLHNFGYIKYDPSYHPRLGSLVYFKRGNI